MSHISVAAVLRARIQAHRKRLPKFRRPKSGAFLINSVRIVTIISMLAPNLIYGVEVAQAAAEQWFPPGVESALDSSTTDEFLESDLTGAGGNVPLLSDTIADQAQAPSRPPRLELWANPAILLPDKPIKLHWRISSWDQLKDEQDIKLVIHLPEGLTPQSASLAAEMNANRELEMAVNQPAGQIVLETEPDVSPPYFISVNLIVGGDLFRENALTLDEGKFEIPQAGGSLEAMGGKVRITVPGKASGQGLAFDVRNPGYNKLPAVSLTGQPIEVVAAGQSTGLEVTSFTEPITLQVTYEEDQIWDWNEEDLMLFYYDEESRDWWPLATTVDVEANTLTAQTDHLTVFDYKAETWQAASLPSTESFQVAGFTGAGTYGMSFWVPPGPGGFQPSLSLNYNSQVIDNSSAFTQASWVGMGWSLDTGSIVRNMHGSNEDVTDDTFSLSVGGVSGLLLPVEQVGTVTTYSTTDQNYMKIEFDSSTDHWTVWGRDGTRYEFYDAARTHTDSGCSGGNNITWRWSLSAMTDKFGNTITYSYHQETKPGCSNVIAVYPEYITYPNDRYRIYFDLETRYDYLTSWGDSDSKILYSKQRLDKVIIQHKPVDSWVTVRQYNLTYSANTSNQIFPAFEWVTDSPDYTYTLTLVGVQELNGDGSIGLPATTFTYDEMHLTKADNGQGGSVTLAYERWVYSDDLNFNMELRSLLTNFGIGGSECNPNLNPPHATAWTNSPSPGRGTVGCNTIEHKLQIGLQGETPVARGIRSIPQHIIQPGGSFRFLVRARGVVGSTDVNWGIVEKTTLRANLLNSDSYPPPLDDVTYRPLEDDIEMPTDYDPLDTVLLIECNDCLIEKMEYQLQPFSYRVTSKTVTDSVASPSATYTYRYDNPAPNSKYYSEAVLDAGSTYTSLYNYPLREFRGHAMSQVVNPEGLANLTWYYQNDALRGTPYHNLVMEQTFWDEFNTLNASNWTTSGGTHAVGKSGIDHLDFDDSVKSVNTAANWDVYLHRNTTYNLANGEAAIAHVRLSGDVNSKGEVGLESSAGKFFGVRIQEEAGQHVARVHFDTGSGPQDGAVVIAAGDISLNTWYAVMLVVDNDDGFLVKMWQLDDPNVSGESRVGFGADTWRYRQSINGGTIWLDAYSEGVLYSESETKYAVETQYDTDAGNSILQLSNPDLLSYIDLKVFWTYPIESISRSYEGDASWNGTRTTYEYNLGDQGGTQYGNLTRAVESAWNGSSWVDYRASKTEFFPNPTAYLVSLPVRQITLDCASGCDFAGESGKLAEGLMLYDDSNSYTTTPTAGHLTAQRAWVEGSNYTQVSYDYDIFGNPKFVTNYTGYGTASSAPTSGAQTTSTTYDTTYNTFPLTVTADNKTITTGYDYSLGLPISVEDPNGNTTTAEYDDFGRMKAIRAPGDEAGTPTLSVTYNDSLTPYRIDLAQKIDVTDTYRLSHFYSGLGQLLQTQSVGTELDSGIKNVVVDYDYDTLGRVYRQTVPL